jgi:hypothetical protein
MDNKNAPEIIHPDGDLLIVELDDRLEFSALPVDVMDLQDSCTNGSACDPNGNGTGCTNQSSCKPPLGG